MNKQRFETLAGPLGQTLRVLRTARWLAVVAVVVIGVFAVRSVLAQAGTSPTSTSAATAAAEATSGATAAGGSYTLPQLFSKSFDFFTILLIIGSIAGWTIIIKCLIEIRRVNIAPDEPVQVISGLCKRGSWQELRVFVDSDDAMVSRIVKAGLDAPGDDMNSVRESAELAASEESGRWFRKLEPLNVIGNLGPLLGLAGTVYGMIIAFAELGSAGGQANPAGLSVGIAKALFHTLLGLMLAVPCLTVFGFYRGVVDRLCTQAMVRASSLVEMLPADARSRGMEGKATAVRAAGSPRPQAAPGTAAR
jgi:biopolymer transport protein ExbB